MKTHIVEIDFNPVARLIWISRLPTRLPRGYTGGRRVRQYRMTWRRLSALHKLTVELGSTIWAWSQDTNGTHIRREVA